MLKSNRSNRNLNRSQRRRYQENDFDIQFDWNRPLNQSCYIILNHISSKDSVHNKNQLLGYLNLFIKYCLYRYGKLESSDQQKITDKNDQNFETFSDTEILCCLRISLFHEVAEVRAASLRAIRYFVQNKLTLNVLLELNLHHFIARSLDIVLENRVERIQSIRLIRHLMAIEPNLFPIALGRCLCAIAHDNFLERDMLLRVCWATIAELTIVNAIVSARSGCISVLVRCALNSITGLNLSEYDDLYGKNNRKTSNNVANLVSGGIMNNFTIPYTNIAISEAILSSFMHLYNFSETRQLLQPNGCDLFYFISPFTDLYSFYHASKAAQEQKKLNAFHLADYLDQEAHKLQIDFKENKTMPYRPGINKPNQQQQQVMNYEQRTLRYLACKNAILSILRSWPGLFFMCRVVKLNKLFSNKLDNNEMNLPRKLAQILSFSDEKHLNDNYYQAATGHDTLNPLESLVSILHLPYAEIHRHLLELFYELFGLKFPEWTENFDEALKCVYFNYPFKRSSKATHQNKNYFPDEWQLYDGFIAREAEDILPSLSSGRLNFITNYYALLIQSLVEFGLLEALISVILDSNDQAAVNMATILTGELLYLSGKFLPPSSYAHRCQSLPTLISASISGSKERRNRALMTISNFNRIHEIKKLGPQPASLFLEQQIYFCRRNLNTGIRKKSVSNFKIQDENVLLSIKNSGVLRKNSFKDWNWDIIADLLKQPYEMMLKLEEKDVRAFTGRLLEFYCPSKRQFSSISKNSGVGLSSESNSTSSSSNSSGQVYEASYFDNPGLICSAAIYFIDFLLQADEARSSEYLEEFIYDLDRCLKNIATKSPSVEEILIPSRLLSTLSNYYFLLLGRFTHYHSGRMWLKKTHIYQHLIDLINLSTNEVYTKLIVSSLDYSEANFPRSILSKVLTSPIESSRIYATKFLRVLLRAGVPDFSKWGVDLLITQLYDKLSVVSLEALDILDEACTENADYLEKVLLHRPALLNLGDKGIVFFTRFASHLIGINMLIQTNMLQNELDRWRKHFCLRYVRLVEDSLNESFSCHQKGITGKYGRRSDKRHFPHTKSTSMTAYLVPHLYGQLVQSYEGLQIVIQHLLLEEVVQIIETQIDRYLLSHETETAESRPTEIDILRMKSALWSIGHIASSEQGLDHVLKCQHLVLNWITLLIERSTVLSLRATGFYVICLIASTYKGAKTLSRYGWIAIQHSHHDSFPIDKQEYENFHLFPSLYKQYHQTDQIELEKSRTKSIVSILSGYFSLFTDNDNANSNSNMAHSNNQPCQFSISSSSSSSSSYLSILPSSGGHERISIEKSQPVNNVIESENLSKESSSTTSLYSNISSVGSLMTTSVYNTITTNSRTRSSSDCISTTSVTTATPYSNISDSKKSKPEYQDSGILDQSCDLTTSKIDSKDISSTVRNRKISEPCFMMSSSVMNNVKIRSDSYESAQTNMTNNTESRSASFTEYSTASSGVCSNVMDQQNRFDTNRNVNFVENNILSPSIAIQPQASQPTPVPKRKYPSSLVDNRQTLIVVVNDDNPYPSPVDAYGYAQLRAIQKRRVQSLSGNMFLSYGSIFSNSISESFKSVDSMSTELFSMDSFHKNSCETQPKVQNNRIISSIHSNSDHSNPENYHLSVSDYPKRRSLSGSSQISGQSELDIGFENVSFVSNHNQPNEKSNFMCLCLPQNLSLIFNLEEGPVQNSKKRVKFPNEPKQQSPHFTQKSRRTVRSTVNEELLDVHTASKCLVCCHDFESNLSLNSINKAGKDYLSNELSPENNQANEKINGNNNLTEPINQSSKQNSNQNVHRQEVLRLVFNLNAVMYAKQSEQGLLSFKQKFPKMFEDFCLYSDVCLLMEMNNFKATARRFLHELFLEINLDRLFMKAERILKKYEKLNPI